MNEKHIPPAQKRTQLSEATINRMLDQQQREQELRLAELKAMHEDTQEQAKLAHRFIEAQIKDRESEREHVRRIYKAKFTGFVIFWIIVFLIITYWLSIGKDEIADDVIKMLISAAFGVAGGYGWRISQEKTNDPLDK